MSFTKTELDIFLKIYTCELVSYKDICSFFNLNKTYISTILNKLIKKNLIIKKKGLYSISNHSFVIKLAQILFKNKNFILVVKDSGLDILLNLLDGSSVKNISKKTKLKEITIYKYFELIRRISLIYKDKNKYFLNTKHFVDFIDFLMAYKFYIESFDNRLPIGSKIYYKNKKEVIFSINKKLDDFSLTSFSIFGKYGIDIFSYTYYYYFPKRRLTKKDILMHTIRIIEKTDDYRQKTYLALFFSKYKSEFKDVSEDILDKIKLILKKEVVYNYPPYKEIKSKSKLYDIDV